MVDICNGRIAVGLNCTRNGQVSGDPLGNCQSGQKPENRVTERSEGYGRGGACQSSSDEVLTKNAFLSNRLPTFAPDADGSPDTPRRNNTGGDPPGGASSLPEIRPDQGDHG